MSDGITSVWLNFCRALRGADDRCSIVFAAPEYLSDREYIRRFEDLGHTVILLPERNHNPVRYVRVLTKLLKDGGFDAIHVNGSSGIMSIEMIAALFSKTRVRVAHSHNTQSSHGILHRLLKPILKMTSSKHVACSIEAGKWLFGNADVNVIHNGIDTEKFRYNQIERENFRSSTGLDKRFVIGHVGKFNYQKNHSFLLVLFREIRKVIPEAVLYLVGDGPELRRIKEFADELGIAKDVIFAGLKDNIPGILSGCDIMLLPSFYEGLPTVAIEWQASGLPAILSDSITTESSPTKTMDFLPLGGELDAWVSKVKYYHDNAIDRLSRSDKNIELLKVEGFDTDSMVHNITKLYK